MDDDDDFEGVAVLVVSGFVFVLVFEWEETEPVVDVPWWNQEVEGWWDCEADEEEDCGC
jgi:hypothetical protein